MKSIYLLTAGLLLSGAAFGQDKMPVKKMPAKVKQEAMKGKKAMEKGVRAVQGRAAKATQMVDEAVQMLEKDVLAGKPSKEAFDGLRKQVMTLGEGAANANPRAGELSKRLNRRIADLEARAQKGEASAEDFSILREQMVDTRLENAIARLSSKASESGLEREDVGRLTTLIQARAEAAKTLDPQAAESSQSMIRAVAAMEKKGKLTPVDFGHLRSSLAEARLDRAMADLEKRAVNKKATKADFERVTEVLADRTDAMGTDQAKTLQTRLQNAIQKLEEKAANGNVTAEEFSSLRDNLVKKAREASASK